MDKRWSLVALIVLASACAEPGESESSLANARGDSPITSVDKESGPTTTATRTTYAAHSTPDELVDALNGVFGKQTDNRAVHAKGIVLEGTYTPTRAAADLSVAPHFDAAVPVTVRFSNFAGITAVSDTDGLANPRGFALKFHLPDGTDTDLVTHSFNGFPSRTSDEFRDLLIALGTSPPGTPSPTPAEKYLGAHPIAKHFLESQQGPPVSYATLAYFGVNSFRFTNAQGLARIGRYQLQPEAGVQLLSAEQVARAKPGYLLDELRTRLHEGPIRFDFLVQLAEAGDRIEDPSVAWPDARRTIDLGRIEITAIAADSPARERELIFLPAALPTGIEPADPMIVERSAAYPSSYSRRHQRGETSVPH